jgi:hypothetical protein
MPHVDQTIGIAGQNNLSPISSLRNVMRNIDRNHARESSHNGKNVRDVVLAGEKELTIGMGIPGLGKEKWGSFRLSRF